jgi:acyl dehydratase
LGFDTSQIGKTRRSEEFRVNTARLAQYAAATDDTNPQHADGRLAPPVFAHVPVLQETVEALGLATDAFAFHGEHDFHLHRPIEPGMRLLSTATVVGLQPTPAGVSIVVHTTTRNGEALVNEQYFTGFAAGGKLDRGAGSIGPGHRVPAEITAGKPVALETYPMAEDQTRRYADASRDYSEYALNLEAAQAKGLKGVLVHGMLTMAFASRAVVGKACGGDPARLRRLAGRFSAPVYLTPGQAVTTRIWPMGRRNGNTLVAYEASDASGAVVIKHGLAEVAP